MNRLFTKSTKLHGNRFSLNSEHFDLSVFLDTKLECKRHSDGIPVTERCAATKRLCAATMYFDQIKHSTTFGVDDVKNAIDWDHIATELEHQQFDKEEIANSILDAQSRLKWLVGSECAIFSRADKQWVRGQIESVILDEVKNEEWITVRYGNNKKERVQRFSATLKAFEFIDGIEYKPNEQIMSIIANQLRIMVDAVGKTLFVEFNEEIYGSMLDDTTHFIKEHSNDIQQVHDEWTQRYGLPKCSVSGCNKSSRHFRRRGGNRKGKEPDAVYSFYESLYDRIHFYIFHLFDIGMRVDVTSLTAAERPDDEKQPQSPGEVDAVFGAERDLIRLRSEECGFDLDGLNDAVNKFSIQTADVKQKVTQTDAVHKKLHGLVTKEKVQRIHHFLEQHAFDSECIEADLEDTNDSNLSAVFQNQSVANSIKEFIRVANLRRRSFSTGFVFDYKNENGKMFVRPRHHNLKEEVLQSGFLSQSKWMQFVDLKAQQLLNTASVRKMKVIADLFGNVGPLAAGSPITLQHLLAIILYCDIGPLCTAFSATFRREDVFEEEASVVSRHSYFAIFGCLLVEMVLSFGINRNEEEGPFYCGMNRLLNIGSFAISLNGPCSTTTVRAVALNFATEGGIIFKLSNEGWNAKWQRFFDCTWISNYAEEAEKLWICTSTPLRIMSITVVKTAMCYVALIRILYLIDTLVSGVELQFGMEVGDSDYVLVSNLINLTLENKDNASLGFDKYLKMEWDLYRQNKEEVVLDLYCLNEGFQSLFQSLMFQVVDDVKGQHIAFKPKWLSIFPSLKSVVVLDYNGMFQFDLEALLETLQLVSSSIITVTVIDEGKWIEQALTGEVSAAFGAEGWDIEYDHNLEHNVPGFGVRKSGLLIKSKNK